MKAHEEPLVLQTGPDGLPTILNPETLDGRGWLVIPEGMKWERLPVPEQPGLDLQDAWVEQAPDRHRLSSGCNLPGARRRWSTTPWVCPECGAMYVTTRTQPGNRAPTVLSWWWIRHTDRSYVQ